MISVKSYKQVKHCNNGSNGFQTININAPKSHKFPWIESVFDDYWLIETRSARKGETSEVQYTLFLIILEIDMSLTSQKEPGRSTFWRFGISKY